MKLKVLALVEEIPEVLVQFYFFIDSVMLSVGSSRQGKLPKLLKQKNYQSLQMIIEKEKLAKTFVGSFSQAETVMAGTSGSCPVCFESLELSREIFQCENYHLTCGQYIIT